MQTIVNRRARFDYELGDEIVAGLSLTGLEVRAAREGHLIFPVNWRTEKQKLPQNVEQQNTHGWRSHVPGGESLLRFGGIPAEKTHESARNRACRLSVASCKFVQKYAP